MHVPRWILVAVLLATDVVAVWLGIRAAAPASFLFVLAGVSATLAFVVRPALAAAATLALLVPAAFLTLMAGPGTIGECGPGCAALVAAHEGMVVRVGCVLASGHLAAYAITLLHRFNLRSASISQ